MARQNQRRDAEYLERRIAQLERRISQLETAARARHATISGAALRIQEGGRLYVGDQGDNLISVDPRRPSIDMDVTADLLGTVEVRQMDDQPYLGLVLVNRSSETTSSFAAVGPNRAILSSGLYGEIQVTPGISMMTYASNGVRRSIVWANAEGAGMGYLEPTGDYRTVLWAHADGNIYHRGSLVEVS